MRSMPPRSAPLDLSWISSRESCPCDRWLARHLNMEAFFLPAAVGQRFCIYHAASGPLARGSLLYIHPFAEEMNKSRRMVALQARSFSNAGYAVLQIDLMGCGDSSGDFADATWESWVQDVTLACEWLRHRSSSPLWIWGLRSGCLIAVEAARRLKPALPL